MAAETEPRPETVKKPLKSVKTRQYQLKFEFIAG
jgi:hypothetical protein